MADAEDYVLAFMTFPWARWTQIYSINPLERLNAAAIEHGAMQQAGLVLLGGRLASANVAPMAP